MAIANNLMNQAPSFLAIAIPTFNRANDLRLCLESVAAAVECYSHPHEINVVVSNNASTDFTVDILTDFQARCKTFSFRWWTNPVNMGAVANFKLLIAGSRAEYTLILTDDDLLLPKAVNLLVSMLKDEKPDFLKASILTYLCKSQKSFFYGLTSYQYSSIKDSFALVLYAIYYAHVFSACVVKSDHIALSSIKSSTNCYPAMQLAALSHGSISFLCEPIILHVHENDNFWEKDVDITTDQAKRRQLSADSLNAFYELTGSITGRHQIIELLVFTILKYGKIPPGSAKLLPLYRLLGVFLVAYPSFFLRKFIEFARLSARLILSLR